MRMVTGIVAALLLATAVQAQESKKQDTQKDCEQILQVFATIQISAGQADLVAQVQKAIAQICRRAIDAEKKVLPPTTEAAPEGEKK